MTTIRMTLAAVLCQAAALQVMPAAAEVAAAEHASIVKMDDAKFNDWLIRWEKNIIRDARNRYCDKVIVKAGAYTEQIGIFGPHAGTPGHLITFQANPGDKVVIDGDKKNSFGFRLGASHIRIDGFEIVNVTGHGILVGWSDGSSLGVQIVNNTIHDCGNHPDTAVNETYGESLIESGDIHAARIHQLESDLAMLREEPRINGTLKKIVRLITVPERPPEFEHEG